MYGNSQFDGNAAFSGGGFMPSQATPTADPSSPAKNREAQGLLSLTVKQIRGAFQASDDKANFLADGVDVNSVKLVGLLFEKTERVTDVSFVLDDGTGRIDCHRWVQEALDTKEMELLSNGTYVKIHGHLKGFHGVKQLVVYSVRGITDYNEIPNHFAECIYVHSYNTRARIQDAPQATGQLPNPAVNTPSKGYQPTSSNNSQFPVQPIVDGMKGIDKLVLNYMQLPSCIGKENGVHRAEIAKHLNVPEHKIIEAIASLDAEGLIYSTIDEFHFRSTVNG
ncbi:replication protein A 32 kDa subunit A-like isoform X2 [Salvia splendens]|uniref:replication protein A 32 kDa subunit A-like isoform X2 n=1 Tax=Salvia splendens TaxID=180675 RepID=UPI001C25C838|nr:replication protein A 32 kDa subunit A-like isoform X2 [Salvia splendens]